MCVIKDVAYEVDASCSYWKNLVIPLYSEVQFNSEILLDVCKQLVQVRFTIRQDNDVICITEVIFNAALFLYPMIEVRQVEICKKLGKIVADGQTICAVDDLIQQP